MNGYEWLFVVLTLNTTAMGLRIRFHLVRIQ